MRDRAERRRHGEQWRRGRWFSELYRGSAAARRRLCQRAGSPGNRATSSGRRSTRFAPGEARAAIDPGLDAALLDVNIGGEFIYPLADELMCKGVAIVFVTGYQAAAIDKRFATFPVLTKPVEKNELALALARAIERSGAAQERGVEGPAGA